jgi:ribonuclease BN (tRNA processing enzyme)
MKIKFLGTNGWHSTENGLGVCTLVLTRGRAIALDAGDGFSRVAEELRATGIKKLDVFLSHLHLDHCEGLHTLAALDRGVEVRIFVEEKNYGKLKVLLSEPFTAPVDSHVMKANVKIVPFKNGRKKGYFLPLALPHSAPTSGFRLEIDGKTLAYCLDSWPCANMGKLAQNAHVFITECSWRTGTKVDPKWPHMTPELAAKQAADANAKMLVLTHFGPTDYRGHADREQAGRVARGIFKNTIIAYDWEALEIQTPQV